MTLLPATEVPFHRAVARGEKLLAVLPRRVLRIYQRCPAEMLDGAETFWNELCVYAQTDRWPFGNFQLYYDRVHDVVRDSVSSLTETHLRDAWLATEVGTFWALGRIRDLEPIAERLEMLKEVTSQVVRSVLREAHDYSNAVIRRFTE